MKKNKIILVGTSPIVEYHVKALKKTDFEIIAVASSNTNSSSHKKFARKNIIKKSYSDWKEMMNKEKYDGIVIATRTESTIEILEHAIKQNIPILVEKPVSFNSKDIKKIINKSHKMIMVGYNRRFYKTVNVVKNLISEEENPILASMTTPELSNIKDFFNNTSHSLDILRYIFGEIKLTYVKKLIINNVQKGFVATFSDNKKDIIQFIANWDASDNFSLSVFQNTKKIELKPYEELSIYDGIDVIQPMDTNPIRQYVPKLVEKITLEPIDKYIKPGFYQQSCTFLELIENKTKSNISATLIDAYKNIEMCEKLVGKYKSRIL
jgi:predicted dehydrogenase